LGLALASFAADWPMTGRDIFGRRSGLLQYRCPCLLSRGSPAASAAAI
jgi:hypothetical protein